MDESNHFKKFLKDESILSVPERKTETLSAEVAE
jgi:hypothetical protein